MKVSTFMTDGFETVEALAVVDLLKRAGIEVDLISISDNLLVKSAQNITIHTDFLLREYSLSATDMIFLPGGPGTQNYEQSSRLIEHLKEFYKANKYIAAICAAPSVLGHLGFLKGRKATCFPGYERELEGAEVVVQKVVTDGNIITGRGMGASLEMGFELVGILKGAEIKAELEASTQYRLD